MRFSIFLLFITSLLAIPSTTHAYEIETHAYLTDEIVEFYNLQFPENKVPEEYRNYLIEGSRSEDNLPRLMNHFYDPVYDRGLTHQFLGNWQSSKDWVKDEENQNSIIYKVEPVIVSIFASAEERKVNINTETNYTWQQAIRFYLNNEKEKAFFTLGHVIHLIEDLSVPDHTRNDPHAADSVYEKWTERFTLTNKDEDIKKRVEGKKVIRLDNLEDFFMDLATYSNNNFYSKDTVGIQSGYQLPQPDYFGKVLNEEERFGFKTDNEFGDFTLLKAPSKIFSLQIDNTEFIREKEILEAYWSRLSTKAIQYGAGVIDLFFKEVEKAKKDPTIIAKKPTKSFFAEAITSLQNLLSKIISAREFTAKAIDEEDSKLPTNTETEEAPVEEKSIEKRVSVPLQKTTPPKTPQPDKPKPETPTRTNQVIPIKPPTSTPVITPAIQTQTPSSNNSSGSTGNSITGTPTTNTTTTPITPIPTPLILISEILFDAEGSDTDKEFIELYNPNNETVNISEWSIQYLGGNATTTEKTVKKNFEENNTISPYGFFLISLSENENADLQWESGSLGNTGGSIFLVKNKEEITSTNDEDVVSKVSYGTGDGLAIIIGTTPVTTSNLEPGNSIERKAIKDSLCVGNNEGEFLGNACNNNDFEIRVVPNPQSRKSLPEPRIAPETPNLTIAYNEESMNLQVSWTESKDFENSSSTIRYKLIEHSENASTTIETSNLSYNKTIETVGESLRYKIQAFDRDGLGSNESESTITIPSFLSSFQFYEDPREGNTNYLLEARYDKYPFTPGEENSWKAIVFYLNSDKSPESMLGSETTWQPQDKSDVINLLYPQCGSGTDETLFTLILPDNYENCGNEGDLRNRSIIYGRTENNRFFISPAISPADTIFTENDYIKIAFYSFSHGTSSGGKYLRKSRSIRKKIS